MPGSKSTPASSATPMKGPLEQAAAKSPGGIRPPALADNQKHKKNYAQYLSGELALMMAACLRPHYAKARITPNEDGTGQEFTVGAKIDSKKTDVGVWDAAAGLILGVSIKTYSFRDYRGATSQKPAHLGRYQKNVKRNDMELRDEADVLHRRQPYAVLFALFFMPKDACWDGVNGHSSFAHAVFTFRKRSGRQAPDSVRPDLFEKVYVGLFSDDGKLEFFDVAEAPPRNQPPSKTIPLGDLVKAMTHHVTVRNAGVAEGERYAVDDPDWEPPHDQPLPPELEAEAPLTFDDALAPEDDDEDDGGVSNGG